MDANNKPLSQRNFALGVVNGTFWMLARALNDPETILPAFAVALMGPNPLWVGILVSLVTAGWFWTPIVFSPVLSTRQRRHPFYQASAAVRIVTMAAIYLTVRFLAQGSPATAFWTIALCYLLYTSAGGMGLIPFMSVITDSVPANRRGAFFGMRYLFGGLLAFGAGFWIKWLLSEESGIGFPDDYALMFGVAAIVAAVSLSVFCFAREPRHKVETRRLPVWIQLVRGFRRARREPHFQRMLAARVTYAAAAGLVFPFLVPYGFKHLGMTEAMVGVLVGVRMLSYSSSNILWIYLSDRIGNRFLLVVSGWLLVGAVMLVALIQMVPAAHVGTMLGLSFDARLALLLVVFAASGAAASGQQLGHMSYMLEFTPERARAVYIATYYLVLLPVAFMPLVTALLIGAGGRYALAFAIGGMIAIATLALDLSLRRLRPHTRLAARGERREARNGTRHRPVA